MDVLGDKLGGLLGLEIAEGVDEGRNGGVFGLVSATVIAVADDDVAGGVVGDHFATLGADGVEESVPELFGKPLGHVGAGVTELGVFEIDFVGDRGDATGDGSVGVVLPELVA